MCLTVLIESHAELSLCMQIHTLLSSISWRRVGCWWVHSRRAGVFTHERSDRSLSSVLTARLGLEQSFKAHVLYLHTAWSVSLLIITAAYLQCVTAKMAKSACLSVCVRPFIHYAWTQSYYLSIGFLHLHHFLLNLQQSVYFRRSRLYNDLTFSHAAGEANLLWQLIKVSDLTNIQSPYESGIISISLIT